MPRIKKALLIRLQKKLKTDAAIGREFGITRQAVHQIRQKYGIESNLINNPERNEEIYNKYKEGEAVKKLVKLYKLSTSQTYRIINTYKKEEEKAAKAKAAKKSGNKKTVKKTVKKKTVIKASQKKAVTTKGKKAVKKPVRTKTKAVPLPTV